MTDNDDISRQPPASSNNHDNPFIGIPSSTSIADVVQLIRIHYREMCIFREGVEAQIANSRDRTNRPRRRHNSTSSLSSNKSDHDILRANSRSQPVPIPAPRTPTPRIPTPVPRTLTPIVRIPIPVPETQMISYQTNQAPSSIRPRSPSSVDRHTTPALSPKDYLQSIPYFDGTPTGYDASEFIVHCKHALSYMPQYREYEILALLTGRLKGEALRRASKAKLRTVQNLINFVKENFDKRKTYFSLGNQILKLEQGTDESMNTYIARAQELLSDWIECLLASNVSNKESAIHTLINVCF
ncbi:hypothetical protein PV325_006142 [Microctonus aethiopoides]|uniref:Uncharacterized protein n=1 Tax=Microctonus aethiopoides TaxID=144406 RepID=A0AA39EZR8_9HYME|nr:hypothetical protein PV325_006142 [Microctonus aethiopoides]KAK0157153.1 hypothetical protein PV328_011817 [Microctonus aethiopoides]